MSLKSKVLDYIENVLEVPRQEYNEMPACPFAKQERLSNNIYIDEITSDNNFIKCVGKFHKSNMNSAVFIQNDDIRENETRVYQRYLNKLLKEFGVVKWKVLCINPNDKLDVGGLNVRSLAPCFLILINPKQQIGEAHKSMLHTKYYDNMSSKYKKYLNVIEKERDR
jgi:hypothetical protein